MRRMMLLSLLPVLSACLLSLSCASDPQPPQPSSDGSIRTMKQPQAWAGAKPMNPPAAKKEAALRQPINASASAKKDATDVPPANAQFTLYCADYTGASHVEMANRAKQELAERSGLRGWYIVHQEDRSTLFYGYYKDLEDPNLKRDRQIIEGLEDRAGNRAVRSAVAVSVDAPDPIAPPEWNLRNLRNGELDTKHYWTLQIAAYQGSPERKQYAVDAVKAARQQGVEAYYFHGPSVSSVCIGYWPLEALKRPDESEVQPEGTAESDQLLITSGDLVTQDRSPNSKLIPKKLADKGKERGVKMVNREIVVRDPTLRQAMETFPQHFVNGEAEGVNMNGKIVPKSSMLVLIPYTGATAQLPAAAPPPPSDAVRALQPDAPPPSSGGGRLKSIGR